MEKIKKLKKEYQEKIEFLNDRLNKLDSTPCQASCKLEGQITAYKIIVDDLDKLIKGE